MREPEFLCVFFLFHCGDLSVGSKEPHTLRVPVSSEEGCTWSTSSHTVLVEGTSVVVVIWLSPFCPASVPSMVILVLQPALFSLQGLLVNLREAF